MLTRDTILDLLQRHGASSDAGKLTMDLGEFWKFMDEALTQETLLVINLTAEKMKEAAYATEPR